MNLRRNLLFLISFLLLVCLAFPVSRWQSLAADQVLIENGLSQDSRSIKPKKNVQIRTLVNKLAGQHVQVHFVDRSQPQRVLVWANYNLKKMPVTEGRYFDKDDFASPVTLAVITPNAHSEILKTQNNLYVTDNNRYYSVVGTLKNNNRSESTRYFLTTGVKQHNSHSRLTHYRLVFDGLTRSQYDDLGHYLKANWQTPRFVDVFRHQHRVFKWGQLIFAILLLAALLFVDFLLAYPARGRRHLGKVHGRLLSNLISNRLARFCVLEFVLSLAAFDLMNWRVFFSNASVYGLLLAVAFILQAVSYYLAMAFWLKKKRD